MDRLAYKRRIEPDKCLALGCRASATYHVFGAHGYHYGGYCDEHADQKMKLLDDYDAAIRRASTGPGARLDRRQK